jgi:hypothetical protein
MVLEKGKQVYVKSFEIAGRRVSFARSSETGSHRVLVDGEVVPMTFEETASRTTNAGDYRKVVVAAHAVEEVPLEDCLAAPTPFSLHSSPSGHRASCTWVSGKGEMYNTSIYEIDSVVLVFSIDFASVHVTRDRHVDTSS